MTPPTTQALTDEARRELLSMMVLIRTYEEAIRAAYYADKKPAFDIGAGLVPGEMHLSAGQEPVAAGICAHLTSGDAITATHRPHHLAIAHGVALRPMTAFFSSATAATTVRFSPGFAALAWACAM